MHESSTDSQGDLPVTLIRMPISTALDGGAWVLVLAMVHKDWNDKDGLCRDRFLALLVGKNVPA